MNSEVTKKYCEEIALDPTNYYLDDKLYKIPSNTFTDEVIQSLPLPELNYDKYCEMCTTDLWKRLPFNKSVDNTPFIKNEDTISVAINISNWIQANNITPSILEVGCGTGVASKIIINILSQIKEFKYIGTDLFKYSGSVIKIETGIRAEEAVKEYHDRMNILLMIKPPPNCLYDYFAIEELLKHNNTKKYIIFVGSIGLRDGTFGIYNYLFKHDKLRCIHVKTIARYHIPDTNVEIDINVTIFETLN